LAWQGEGSSRGKEKKLLNMRDDGCEVVVRKKECVWGKNGSQEVRIKGNNRRGEGRSASIFFLRRMKRINSDSLARREEPKGGLNARDREPC